MKVTFLNRMLQIVVCMGALSLASGLNAQEAASTTTAPASDAAVPVENDLPLCPVLTLGVLGGEDYFEGRADTLLPVWSLFDGHGLVLGNMRAAFGDEGAQELNIGLLYRHYVSNLNAILGANVYYDGRWTELDSQFNQLGLGLECLTTWVDARVNVYIPESDKELVSRDVERVLDSVTETTRYQAYADHNQVRELQTTTRVNNYRISTIDVYEVPLEGVDAEIGVKLPLGLDNIEARLFGGYYEFEPKWDGNLAGDDKISGVKGRFEVRAWNSLFLNAEIYENDDLYGSDYLMSASIRLPLGWDALKDTFGGDLNASRNGRRGPLTVSERMLELVVRDPQIQVRNELDVFEEIAAEIETIIRDIVLIPAAVFVYGGTQSAVQDGTAEHPFDMIQEGVDASVVLGIENVYVYGAMTPYQESILIQNNSINLIGEGVRIGSGSIPTYGYGRPIIEAQIGNLVFRNQVAPPVSPAILWARDAEQVTISGFAFTGPSLLSIPTPVKNAPQYPLVGILAEDIAALTIANNEFDNLTAGVVAMNPTVGGFNHRIAENRINNVSLGITSALSMDGNVAIGGNAIDNALLGIAAFGMNMGGRATVDIFGNEISGRSADRYGLSPLDLVYGLLPPGKVAAQSRAALSNPTLGGVLALALPGADMDVRVRNNVIAHPALGVAGIAFSDGRRTFARDAGPAFGRRVYRPASLDLEVSGNTLTGGGDRDLGGLLGLGNTKDDVDFDLAGFGIGSVSVGDGVMNNTIIANNRVSDYLVGIGAVSLRDGVQTDAIIGGNVLQDNVVGILGLAALGGDMQRISIANNTVRGGSLALRKPLLSDLDVKLQSRPRQLPDINLAGISLIGVDGANLDAFSITGNRVEDNLLGIAVAALSSSAMNGSINDNVLEDNTLGVAAVAFASRMRYLEIARNRISGGGTLMALGSLLGKGFARIGEHDSGISGITLLGIDSHMGDFDIHNNVIREQAVGIGVIGWNSLVNNGRVADNDISDSTIGIAGVGIGRATRMRNLEISGNSVVGLEEGGLIGIGLLGSGQASVANFAIQDNDVSQNALGIGAFRDGRGIFYGDISLNLLSDCDTGVIALALRQSIPLPFVKIHDNTEL